MNNDELSMNNSEKISWIKTTDGIALQKDNTVLSIPVIDIIRIEFKGQNKYQDLIINNKPSSILTDIRLNRYPAKIFIELHIPLLNKDKPVIKICFTADSNIEYLSKLPTSDQIIISNSWYPLIKEDLDELSDIFKRAGFTEAGNISLRQYLVILQMKSELVKIIQNQISSDEINNKDNSYFSEYQKKLDTYGFIGTLYEYQKSGISWLCSLSSEEIGCILADEMGLGKTVQIISLVTIYKTIWNIPTLIITPATLLENWRREFYKFSPNISVHVHTGSQRTGFPSVIKLYDVIITSYDLAVRDQGMFSMINFSFIILDEAQAIKNPETRRSIAIKDFKRKVSIAVTGTPVENRLRDLWSIMNFSCSDLLGDLTTFEKNVSDTTEDAANLESIVTPFVLRRKIIDVAQDLPEKIIIPQAVSMDEESVKKYNFIRQQIIDEYGDSATLVSLTKLRQFCAHPFLLEDYSSENPSQVSPKFKRLLEIIEEIQFSLEKVIIFTSYLKMSDLICSVLEEQYNIQCWKIDGRTPVPERQQLVDIFTAVQGTACLVLNPKAAGTGLNITAANHVIHYNLEWNPAVEDQASSRSYRRGQLLPVTIHRLFYPDTIEEVMNDRIQLKRSLAEAAVVGTNEYKIDSGDIARALAISPGINGAVKK